MVTDQAPKASGLSLTPEQIERLKQVLAAVPLHQLLQIEAVEVTAEHSSFRMPNTGGAHNPGGNFHGGAIATLVDVCAGTAAALGSPNFRPGVNTLVTADMHVRYLGRARGGVVGDARVIRAGRQMTVVECQIHDEKSGKLVAAADFSSMVVDLRAPAPGGDAESPDI